MDRYCKWLEGTQKFSRRLKLSEKSLTLDDRLKMVRDFVAKDQAAKKVQRGRGQIGP